MVQGPPGTGKSHTISNLICHLLANGKKVLVTAYTKRALEVLKDKLPSEFKNLTVNLLSGDSSSIQDLEASVNTINDELANTNIESLQQEIEKLEIDLSKIKENRAYDINNLLKIKEKSSRKIDINPAYQGNLTEIAGKLENVKSNHDWYIDDFIDYKNNEIFKKLENYISLFQHYANVDKSIYEYQLPKLTELFDLEDFGTFINMVSIASKNNISKDTCEIIKCQDFELIENYFTDLRIFFNKIEINQHPNKKELIADFLNNRKKVWLNRTNKSKSILIEFDKFDLRSIDLNVEIVYPKGKSLINLKNDAKTLLDFLNEGNVLSGFSFKLKKSFLSTGIKEKLYFIDSVKVNGSPCNTKEEFITVINDIKIKQNFEELYEIWDTNNYSSNSFNDKLNFYQQLYNETLELFEIISRSQEKIKHIQSISNNSFKDFSIDTLNQVITNTENTLILNKIDNYTKKRNELLSYLSQKDFHPIASDIYRALSNLELNECGISYKNLELLQKDFEDFARFQNLRKELSQNFQNLIEKIENSNFTICEMQDLKQAILYRHAFNELTNLLSSDFERELNEKIKSYDSKEEKLIAVIAAKKSWVFVLDNLNRNRSLRQHLEAWVQAVKKIGKTGIGKRALKFRKIAQEEMEYCKTSVPCWIMPLYKVAETIKPEMGIYDYVIIDEASQLGPDAIFLLYISKNIIIVGDDKQTSPEYVGVDANAMTPFINRYLQGIPFKNFYGTEYSFFDHAKRFCEGITVLREHFRCMPEIIEFSNKLFYAPDGKGLYPLKQYSENRLEPLMHIYCQSGYVEGQGANIRNEQEAIEISKKIYEIVSEVKYKGKSIGVICMQGTAQSALIETLLVKQIGETEFKKRKIICGNSASFQGDERDIIILSLVTAHNHNRSALTRPEDERRFNVAVSRAIEQIWLFHSVLLEDLSNSSDLRYKLLDHFINYKPLTPPTCNLIERTLGNQPDPFDSWFEVDIFNDIVNKGYSVKSQYEVAKGKYRIDLVAFFPDGTKIAIECDGDKWHGADKYQDDMMRQKVLERCGWQFFRIRGGEYYSNREKALVPLWAIFKEHELIKEKACVPKIINIPVSCENFLYIKANNEIKSESNKNIETKTEENFESKTCFWSTTYKTGYKFAPNKNAWYKSKDSISSIEDKRYIKNESQEKTALNLYQEESDKKDLFNNNPDLILGYFNLFKNGTYFLTNENSLNADYILPIQTSQKNGFLLQCYESGHVNKVLVSTLLSRKVDKEYMNGLSSYDNLKLLTIIETDAIIGIFFIENGIKKFKAHLTENISCREQLHLQGLKVMYNEFYEIEYVILPIKIQNEIRRLIYQNFPASGKPVDNSYYNAEWSLITKYVRRNKKFCEPTIDIKATDIFPTIKNTISDLKIKLNSIVKIKYQNKEKEISIQLVEYHVQGFEVINGIQKIAMNSPLAIAIIGKTLGDRVEIKSTNNFIEILEIIN